MNTYKSFPRIVHQLSNLRTGPGAIRLNDKIGSLRFRIAESHTNLFQPFWADILPRIAYNNPQINISVDKLSGDQSHFVVVDSKEKTFIERPIFANSVDSVDEEEIDASVVILENLAEASIELAA